MTVSAPSGPQPPLTRGIALILGAAFVISTQDAVIKTFSGQLTLWQIFALRGVIVVVLLVGYSGLKRQHTRLLRQAFLPWPLLRAMCITTTFLCFYAAIAFVSLSTAGAANYSAPIFIAVLSATLLGQKVRLAVWVAVILGFVGVFFLLRPGSDVFSPWVILPLIGAVFYAGAHLITNLRCQDSPLLALALAQNTVMLGAGAIASLLVILFQPASLAAANPYIFGPWTEMTPALWLVIVALSGFAIVASVLLAGAYRAAPPARIAPLEYSYLLFVAGWDIALFGLLPDALSTVGIVFIVGAGCMIVRSPKSGA